MFDPGKKRAPSNDSRLERARGDLEEGRAGEGNFGKMLSNPESCYTMWPPFTVQAQVAPFLLPTLRPAGEGVRKEPVSASQGPFTQSAVDCKKPKTYSNLILTRAQWSFPFEKPQEISV